MMSQSHNSKVGQSYVSEQVPAKQGRLRSLVLRKGNLHLPNSEADLPQFLIRANEAVAAGRVEQASRILNSKAIEVVSEIVDKDPSRTDVMLVLAMIFRQTSQMSKAEQWYKKILRQEPNPLVCNELGYIYQCTGRLSQAMQYQRRAIEANPDEAELWAGLARTLIMTGRMQEGIDLLRKAVEIEPENAAIHSNLLFYLHHQPQLDPQVLFDEHRRWGLVHAPASGARTAHDNTPNPSRRLRVGYISPDFRMHPVAYFFEPLLDGHNHEVVEVYGYGNVAYPDQVTKRLKVKFDHYRNIRGLSDEVVADMIQQDKIDILVELAGHTADNRLLVLAYKPAPIQVTYLGSPDTTGMNAIDYRFTDALADSPQSQRFYTEELFFLPDGFLCYKPADFAPPVASLPASRNGYITFGSFNSSSKIHPQIIELWAQILKANVNSRMVLKLGISLDRQMSSNYFRQFERFGINPDRVAVCGWKTIDEHLKLYGEVDIALDTYPCNGYTTTCEALWMGVPIISRLGRCHASRVGLSILSSIGLDCFAASSPEDYVARATALAANRQALAKIRASMRQRMTASALCDAGGFTRRVEAAYRKMWRRWCQTRLVDAGNT